MNTIGLAAVVTLSTLLLTWPLLRPPPRDPGRRLDERPPPLAGAIRVHHRPTRPSHRADGVAHHHPRLPRPSRRRWGGTDTAHAGAAPSTAVPARPLPSWTARRHRRRVAARLPDAVELLVLAVRSGSTPTGAVHDVAPLVDPAVRPAFDAVVHRLERGRALADAITALPELLGAAAAPVADAITAADRYGTPLGPVLDGLASDARDDRRRAADAHARRLPVRLSFPLVTCTLPSFVLLTIVPALLGALTGLPASPLAH